MAERRPERPLEHQSSEPVRVALGASSVSFQVSRLTDRTARAWGQGVPQAVVALRAVYDFAPPSGTRRCMARAVFVPPASGL